MAGYSIVGLIQRAIRNLLSLGGVLGLAISLYFYRRYRRNTRHSRTSRLGGGEFGAGNRSTRTTDTSATARLSGQDRGSSGSSGAAVRPAKREGGEVLVDNLGRLSSDINLPQYIQSTYKKSSLVVSIPSILTLESAPITHAATAHGPTVTWLKDQLKGRTSFQVYLVCHVEDDVGEAVVSAMLEHCGLVPEVVPAHRVLFVGNVMSTVSIVRQLDPGAYVGNDEHVCTELRRFYKERGRIMAVREVDRDVGTNPPGDGQSRLRLGLWTMPQITA